MVAELIAAGCSPDVAAQVVARAYVAGVSSSEFRGNPVDTAAEKRRAYDRERKREKRNSTGIPPDSAECPNTPLSSSNINRKRGERLPPDFQPDRGIAKQLGWSDSQIDSEIENFRDYWIAKPGAGGCKLDWPATWRKWVRSSKVKPAGTSATVMPTFSTPAGIDWRNVVTFYKKSGIWSKWAGPDPNSPACKAPPELLREFGLLKSA
jgi:hypothetical protein